MFQQGGGEDGQDVLDAELLEQQRDGGAGAGQRGAQRRLAAAEKQTVRQMFFDRIRIHFAVRFHGGNILVILIHLTR